MGGGGGGFFARDGGGGGAFFVNPTPFSAVDQLVVREGVLPMDAVGEFDRS
jgi:hypothetical protein